MDQKMIKNLENRTKGILFSKSAPPSQLSPLLLFISGFYMGYFKIFLYSSSRYLYSTNTQRYLGNVLLLVFPRTQVLPSLISDFPLLLLQFIIGLIYKTYSTLLNSDILCTDGWLSRYQFLARNVEFMSGKTFNADCSRYFWHWMLGPELFLVHFSIGRTIFYLTEPSKNVNQHWQNTVV